MLRSLHIENVAVIETLDMDFSPGLTVLTGETGAGKSVMMEAIAFLLGAKPRRELLRSGAKRAFVSAVFSDIGAPCRAYLAAAGFDDTEDEILLERTLDESGGVRARLNGRAVTQSILRETAGYLLNIQGQNDNLQLLRPAVQLEILDSVAGLSEDMALYGTAYRAWQAAKKEYAELSESARDAARMRDVYAFQIGEIDRANLHAGEEEELTALRLKLQNIEKISKQSEFIYHILHGSEKGAATLILERAAETLEKLSAVIPSASDLAAKLSEMRYETEDIANTVRDYAAERDGDPTAALDRVEARLDLITKLRRKYGEDIEAILAFRKTLSEKLGALENTDERKDALEKEITRRETELRALAAKLSERRLTAAKTLSAAVLDELLFLDMSGTRFEIVVRQNGTLTESGVDTVEFCLSANKGEPLLPLARVASGGELSRVMLALKAVLNDRDGVGTAVFDETDAGVSGKTARKIGIKLAEIGKKMQVFAITHSAQVASLAATHLKIAKSEQNGRVQSFVTVLDEEGRVAEVARILGGLSVTPAAVAAARDMLLEGREYR